MDSPAKSPATAPRRRGWKWILAVVLGAFLLLFLIAVAVLVPIAMKANVAMQSTFCQSKLHQLALGARIHAVNHDSKFPNDWTELTGEFANPMLLVCTDDKAHPVAADWASVGASNITYAYLARGADDGQTNRVVAFCPVHGHLVVVGGRVYPGAMKRAPDAITERDGAQWFDPSKLPASNRTARQNR